jgi:anaerobic magnesium-protoporphyrin IX monomethyl ester cyclase
MAGIAVRRICLVQPSSETPYESGKFIWPPLGLMCLAATLRQAGHRVRIIDGILEGFDLDLPVSDEAYLLGLAPDELARRILDDDPDVVGMSLLFVNQIRPALAVARIIRAKKPDALLLWGGPIITMNPEKYAALPEIDALVVGEGDIVVPRFLANLAKDGRAAALPPGCGIRRGDGQFQFGDAYGPVEDLNQLPMPARDLVDMDGYTAAIRHGKVLPRQLPASTMMTARGCPRRCTFCSAPVLYKRSYKMRSPELVLAEIDELVTGYGIREICILDENFAVNRKRVDRILDGLLERDYGISWYCASGIEIPTLTEDLLEKMARTGLYKLKMSFESANDRVLKELIKKPIDVAHGERIAVKAKELGLAVAANFIIGYPGETRAEIMDSFEFAKRVDFDLTMWNLATPYAHTELTEMAIADGHLAADFDYNEIKAGVAFFDAVDATKDELTRWRYEFWHDLHFSSPEKTERYHRYEPLNPAYVQPKRPA